MLWALTPPRKFNSKRIDTNSSKLCKRAEVSLSSIYKQLWTKSAAEYRSERGKLGWGGAKKNRNKVELLSKIYYFDPKKIKRVSSNELCCDLLIHLVFIERTITIGHKKTTLLVCFFKKNCLSYLQESCERNSRITFCSSLDIEWFPRTYPQGNRGRVGTFNAEVPVVLYPTHVSAFPAPLSLVGRVFQFRVFYSWGVRPGNQEEFLLVCKLPLPSMRLCPSWLWTGTLGGAVLGTGICGLLTV